MERGEREATITPKAKELILKSKRVVPKDGGLLLISFKDTNTLLSWLPEDLSQGLVVGIGGVVETKNRQFLFLFWRNDRL